MVSVNESSFAYRLVQSVRARQSPRSCKPTMPSFSSPPTVSPTKPPSATPPTTAWPCSWRPRDWCVSFLHPRFERCQLIPKRLDQRRREPASFDPSHSRAVDRGAPARVGGRARTGGGDCYRGPVCHKHHQPDAVEYATAVRQRWRRLRAVRPGTAGAGGPTAATAAEWGSSASQRPAERFDRRFGACRTLEELAALMSSKLPASYILRGLPALDKRTKSPKERGAGLAGMVAEPGT